MLEGRYGLLVKKAAANVSNRNIASGDKDLAIVQEISATLKKKAGFVGSLSEKEYWAMFESSLAKYCEHNCLTGDNKLAVLSVVGRRNCFFLAMSLALFGDDCYSRLLRKIAGDYLLNKNQLRLALLHMLPPDLDKILDDALIEEWKTTIMLDAMDVGGCYCYCCYCYCYC